MTLTACTKLSVRVPLALQRIESPLKHPTRCLAAFPGADGFAMGSIEGRVAIQMVEDAQKECVACVPALPVCAALSADQHCWRPCCVGTAARLCDGNVAQAKLFVPVPPRKGIRAGQ